MELDCCSKLLLISFAITVLFSVTLEQDQCLSGPVDCVLSDWEPWSECSHTCGNHGVRERQKTVLRPASCNGKCNEKDIEFSPCNRHCCCEYRQWNPWGCDFCSNSSKTCNMPGERWICSRTRSRIPEPVCDGICEAQTFQTGCSILCCYTTCVVGEWSFWGSCQGQCEQQGTQYRTRDVIRQPKCGADPCPETRQNQTCNGRCCPVDCVLGDWSVWTECNTTCGIGHKTRRRFVQKPECYGKECSEDPAASETVECEKYINEDCVVSPWMPWSRCLLLNGFCGEGKKKRDRTITVDRKCKGIPCPDLRETEVCYGPCCRQDCVVSEWTEWGLCSTDCGTGNSTRKREVTVQPSCNGTACPALSEQQECKVEQKIDCQMAPWSEWSMCNNDCGNGKAFRSRSVQTKAYCGGADCDDKSLDDEKDCYHETNKDCVMSDWSEWGDCKINCEGGVRKRNRTIKENYVCKGAKCDPLIDAQINCMAYTCEQNCDGGICSCKHGYRLEDEFRCREVRCPRVPSVKYCGKDYTLIINCIYPKFDCTGDKFEDNCTAYCPDQMVLKGDVDAKTLTCQLNGQWTTAQVFCAPVNNPPTDLLIDETAKRIPENTAAGTCIGNLQTKDDDYDKHTYTIVNDEKFIFELQGSRVCLTNTTNYEIPPIKWSATFKSTDLNGASITRTFSFEIINENDKPKDVKLTPNSIPENSPAGTKIGCLEGIDDDPGQTVSLLLVDSDKDIFATYILEDGQLCLKVKKESDPLCKTDGGKYCVLNMEDRRIRRVTVLATDDGSPPKDAYIDVKIFLTNANDKPVEIQLQPPKVPEEIEAGQPIADLVTIDEDKGQIYTYELLKDTEGIFSIKDGKLVCSRKLDYESESNKEFVIEVKSTDNGSPSLSVTSTIKFMIEDVNEAPFDLQLTSSSGDVDAPKISENKRSVMIGTISVKDQDGDALGITVEDTANGRISYMNKRCKAVTEVKAYCTARLIAFDMFNYETEPTIPLIITATDAKGLSVQKNLTLSIVNMNDKPTDILINGNSTTEIKVPENKNSFKIADLLAEDEDTEDSHTFSLITADGLFQIVSNSKLMTSSTANLDYETKDTHQITVLVLDNGTPPMSLQKTFTMKVTNENEAPTKIFLSNDRVTENSLDGTLVGKLTADDPDNVNTVLQNFTYTLTDDASGRMQIIHDELKVKKSYLTCNNKPCILDYESEPELSVRITVTDSGTPPLAYEQIITIYVDDANDPPQDIRLSRDSLRENEVAGATVGKLTAMDQDVGQSFHFTLMDNNDIFSLSQDNTVVTKLSLNHEQKSTYNVTVRCTDNGTPQTSTDTVLTINVLDVNEAPEYTGLTSLQVSENVNIGTVVGGLIASDVDDGDELTFDVGSSTEFKVQEVTCQATKTSGIQCTGNMVTKVVLDYEVQSTYQVSVTVEDKQGLAIAEKLTVTVKDENDDPQNIYLNGKSVDVLEIEENIENVKIADLSTEDPDQGQTFTYRIKSGDEGIFEILGSELKVKSGAKLDYEHKTEYVLLLEVTDSGQPAKTLEKSVTVQIQNVNEPPSSVSISSNQLEENSDEGTVIGSLTTVDPDNADQNVQTFTYILVDSAEGRFKVQNGQLQVAVSNKDCIQNGGDSCKLDYEGTRSYTVKVLVTDSGHPSRSNTFNLNIDITDANDPPRDIKLSGYKVQELAPKGTEIGRLTVDDQDGSQKHTFTLQNDDSGLFAISPDGVLSTATDKRLDVTKVYEITVRAADDGTPQKQVEGTFSITATGVNEAPVSVTFTSENTPITFEENKPVVMENSAVDSVIGTVVAKDQDPDQLLTFTVKATTDVQYIKVDTAPTCNTENGMTTCKMKILVAEIMDHESMPDLTFIIEVTDKDGMKIVEIFKLLIQDQNEAPTDLIFSSIKLEINENLQGETLGVFQAVDADDGDSHVFKLTNDGGGNFDIDNTGRLSTSAAASLDYEATKTVSITVSVTDKQGLSFEKSFTVSVIDVNEAPTALVLSNDKVLEMSPIGTAVGQLKATDPDEGQTMTYKLIDDAFGRFKVEGDEIKVNSVGDQCVEKGGHFCLLDYESKKSYDIVVKTTDSGDVPNSVEFALTINIEDGNDAPTDLTMTANNIPENTPVGQTVATFNAKDVDQGQALTYKLVSGGNEKFSVVSNTLKLDKPLDFEEQQRYNLTVEVTDNGNPAKKISNLFTLKVVNSNEEPYNLQIEPKAGSKHFKINEPTIDENQPESTLIGQLVVLDHDSLDKITFYTANSEIELYNQKCVPLTNVLRCTADVRSREVFDFEKKSSVSLDFTATDLEGASIKKTVTLSISDSNDAPTDILINGQSVDSIKVTENSKDITLATLSAVDPDVGQSHSFSILSETQYFYIVGKDLKVTSAAELDYEEEPVHEIKIRVSDHANPPLYFDKVVKITLTDVNEKPVSVKLSRNQVAENSKDGDLVGMFNTFDPDNVQKQVQTFEYKLIDNAGNRFKLEGNNLLVSSVGFDYEATKSYTLKVSVTDSGEPKLSLETTFTIFVTDSNDAPRNLQISAQVVDENTELGTEVGVLTADDDDSGQTLSYSVGDNDYFSISGNKLLVNGPIDFESRSAITIQVSVTDNGVPQLSAKETFTIQVRDQNDIPDVLDMTIENKFKGQIISEDTQIKEVIGTIVAEDPDKVDHLVIELLNSADGTFKLSSSVPQCTQMMMKTGQKTKCTINLEMAKVVNYEDITKPLELTIKVTDKGKLELTRSWSFTVANVNEPPRDIIIDSEVRTIPENSGGFLIGQLQSVDDDVGDKHSYHIVTNWESFSISRSFKDQKLIVRAPGLDFESRSMEGVTIRSTDSGSLTYTKTFRFNVTDVNEAPSKIALSIYEVSNAAEVGEVVAKVEVTDPDNARSDENTKQTHKCTVGGEGLGVFQIDSSAMTLQIQSKIPLDINMMNITITCEDNGVPVLSRTEDISLSIKTIVKAPKGIILKNQKKVKENVAPFTVGTFQVINLLTDQPIDSVFFFLKRDDIPFEIVEQDLVVTSALDYEKQMEHIVEVEAGGPDKLLIDANFTILVEDVNEAPHGISISGSRVAENSATDTIIGNLHTQDSETDQKYTYQLLTVASGLDVSLAKPELKDTFKLEDGILKVGSASQNLNHEEADLFSILVNTVDSGSVPLSYNGTVRILVEDVNDPPSEVTLDNSQIAENSNVGAVVGTFTVQDEDKGQTHKCDVLNLNDVPFRIENKVNLVVSKKELDFETKRKYVVEVQCSDISEKFSSLQIRKTFTIDVTNINEPPYNIVLLKSDIDENNGVGDLVGEIQATDVDSTKITFSLEGQQTDFAIQGDHSLIANTELDYETKSTYTVVVKAADDDGLSSTQEFTIKVVDVNEPPTKITLDNLIVDENSDTGTVIGTLKTADPDKDQTFTYTVIESSAESGYFSIKGNKLVIGNRTVDFEKVSEHQIFINSTDSGQPPKTIQAEFTISIKDINEAPINIILGTLDPVPENAPANTILSKIQVDDPDADQSHFCNVMTSSTPFSILTNEKKEMNLVLIGILDYESKSEYKLDIQCTDGEFKKEKTITVRVQDVNEAPELISLSGTNSIVANAGPGYVIGQLSVKDPDIGQKFTFSIVGKNSDLLEVKDSKLQMLTKIPISYLEAENPVIQVKISAADNGNPSLSVQQTFNLPITNMELVAEELPDITIDNQTLKEDAKIGTVIGALHSKEEKLGKDIVFELVNNKDGLFSIKDNKHLILAKNLSMVEGQSRMITIKVKNTQTFETSTADIVIFIERIDKCKKDGRTCDDNARCIQVNDGQHQCQCEIGFEGDGYTCTDTNDCLVTLPDGTKEPGNPCQNQGKCIDQDNGYACECLKGFNGPNCEINTNVPSPCNPNPCQNRAACLPDKQGEKKFTCECSVGWMDDLCDKSINDCERMTCSAGSCVDKHRTILCIPCPPDRKGVWCEYMKTTCDTTNICSDNSKVCVPKRNEDKSDCISCDTNCVTLKVKKPTEVAFNKDEFIAKTKEVINSLCNRLGNGAPAKRRKRATADIGVDTYVVDVIDNKDGTLNVVLAIRATEGTIYESEEVLTFLVKACKDTNSQTNVETEYCPAIMATQTAPEKPVPSDKGLPIPIIAGAAGGAVVLIIIVIVVIVICKKKQNNSSVDPSIEGTNKNKEEPDSRRSSGYSSLRKKNQEQSGGNRMSEFHGPGNTSPGEEQVSL